MRRNSSQNTFIICVRSVLMYTCIARNWKFGFTIRRMQLCSMRKYITLNALYSNTGRNVHSRVSSLSRSFHLFLISELCLVTFSYTLLCYVQGKMPFLIIVRNSTQNTCLLVTVTGGNVQSVPCNCGHFLIYCASHLSHNHSRLIPRVPYSSCSRDTW
jgi:hypothetical protein